MYSTSMDLALFIVDAGHFSLADAVMQNSNTEVKVYGEGDLANWDMNTVFNIRYKEPKYLPEFSSCICFLNK